ncbi:MAG: ankyrin repeat domain-containing protein [Sphingobacteriia bacterium]|nr:ankyrin repeat domain-containing protein [Sphingobacteriia bacterium]
MKWVFLGNILNATGLSIFNFSKYKSQNSVSRFKTNLFSTHNYTNMHFKANVISKNNIKEFSTKRISTNKKGLISKDFLLLRKENEELTNQIANLPLSTQMQSYLKIDNKTLQTIFYCFIKHNKYQNIKALLDINANIINLQDENGNSALHYAVLSKNTKIVKLLMDKGANLNLLNFEGYSPIHLAVEKSLFSILELLFCYSFDRNKIEKTINLLDIAQNFHIRELIYTKFKKGLSDQKQYLNNFKCQREIYNLNLEKIHLRFR